MKTIIGIVVALALAVGALFMPATPVSASPMLTVHGALTVGGRTGQPPLALKSCYIEIWHTSGLLLDWTYTSVVDGSYEFDAFENTGGQIYVKAYAAAAYDVPGSSVAYLMCLHRGGVDVTNAYIEPTGAHSLIGTETSYEISEQIGIPSSDDAFWIKEDLETGFRFPVQHGGSWPSGSYIAEWEGVWDPSPFDPPNSSHYNCGGHMLINSTHAQDGPDVVLHEMGHNVMYNAYGGWWPEGDIPRDHQMGVAYNAGGAWREGWATFWALAVTGTGMWLGYDMEDPLLQRNWQTGPEVEGRVAAALWDLLDDSADPTYPYSQPPVPHNYDSFPGGFDEIWAELTSLVHHGTFEVFWLQLKTRYGGLAEQYSPARALYQNTIKYEDGVLHILSVDDSPGVGTIQVAGQPAGRDPSTVLCEHRDLTINAVPEPGYAFVPPWLGTAVAAGKVADPQAAGTTLTMDADYTLEANFGPASTHTLTYSAGANGTISGSSPQNVPHGGSGTPVAAVPNTGYHFTQWNDLVMTASRTDTNVTADINVTANFAPDSPTTHTINASAGAGGSISPAGSVQVNHGSNQAFNVTASGGYHISDVLVDGGSAGPVTSYTFTSITADHTIAAGFAPNSPGAPSITTVVEAELTYTTVTLDGWLNSPGSSGSANLYFEWGLTTSYGTTVGANPPSLSSVGFLWASIGGLSPGTTYHYRAKAVGNGTGLVGYGADRAFTTLSTPPAVNTNPATNITETAATFNGNLISKGTAQTVTVEFEWGLTPSYGNIAGTQDLTSTGPFSANVTGLLPGTTYHYRDRASGNGVVYGNDQVFVTTGSPWLGTWAKRVEITVDHTRVDTDLTHFPVLVYLSADSGINSANMTAVFTRVGANWQKIAVTQADGVTQLYVEVEKWDNANAEAWLWVSRSGWSLSSSADTKLYLYYDGQHADNADYVGETGLVAAGNVWDGGFAAVYHMADSAGTVLDSTSNNNDGTKYNGVQPANGLAGKAQDFDATDDYIGVPNSTSLNITGGEITVTMLFQPDTLTESDLLQKGSSGSYAMWLSGSGITSFIRQYDGTSEARCTTTLQTDNPNDHWYVCSGVKASGAGTIFLDGVLDGTDPVFNDFITAGELWIGKGIDGRFDGLIDEVRISSVARSAPWIRATSHTFHDDMLNFGTEQSLS